MSDGPHVTGGCKLGALGQKERLVHENSRRYGRRETMHTRRAPEMSLFFTARKQFSVGEGFLNEIDAALGHERPHGGSDFVSEGTGSAYGHGHGADAVAHLVLDQLLVDRSTLDHLDGLAVVDESALGTRDEEKNAEDLLATGHA